MDIRPLKFVFRWAELTWKKKMKKTHRDRTAFWGNGKFDPMGFYLFTKFSLAHIFLHRTSCLMKSIIALTEYSCWRKAEEELKVPSCMYPREKLTGATRNRLQLTLPQTSYQKIIDIYVSWEKLCIAFYYFLPRGSYATKLLHLSPSLHRQRATVLWQFTVHARSKYIEKKYAKNSRENVCEIKSLINSLMTQLTLGPSRRIWSGEILKSTERDVKKKSVGFAEETGWNNISTFLSK